MEMSGIPAQEEEKREIEMISVIPKGQVGGRETLRWQKYLERQKKYPVTLIRQLIIIQDQLGGLS